MALSEKRLDEIRALLCQVADWREQYTGVMGPSDRPEAPMVQAARDLLDELGTQTLRKQQYRALTKRLARLDVSRATLATFDSLQAHARALLAQEEEEEGA